LLGAAVVFFLFASIGFVTLQMGTGERSGWDIFLSVALSGGFAVGYATFGILRRYRLFVALGVLHFLSEYLQHRFQRPQRSLMGDAHALQHQLTWLGVGGTFSIVFGYLILILFVRRLGKSYFRIQTEMALAADIHRSLVPPIQTRLGNFEIYGVSWPSGEVGGDLVDVAENQGGWTGYIADVSGHGVSSGVLMAMFKTAMRTRLMEGDSPAQALNGVHRALFPLKPPQMFVTVAMLQNTGANRMQFASAGHPPVLHYHRAARRVTEYPPLDAPVGVLDGQSFSESAIEFAPGDVLLILTDGLTEVFDRRGNELGIEALKTVFATHAESPLPDLYGSLRAMAKGFGAQSDDQTVLLARHLAA
jgi:serine phosphatase RsbU (regulator of sigma subunit)